MVGKLALAPLLLVDSRYSRTAHVAFIYQSKFSEAHLEECKLYLFEIPNGTSLGTPPPSRQILGMPLERICTKNQTFLFICDLPGRRHKPPSPLLLHSPPLPEQLPPSRPIKRLRDRRVVPSPP